MSESERWLTFAQQDLRMGGRLQADALKQLIEKNSDQ